MAEQTRPAGSIYDLGYQQYTGPRLGRRYAVMALYVYSLRAIFGLGRSTWSKVFPFGLAVVALVPATVQLAIAAVAPLQLTVVRPEEYFGFVQIVVALFCAVVTPEIIGRDMRNHTLPLYFSHALSRADYVSAKLGALVVALFAVLALPQIILYVGSALATQHLLSYLGDNLDHVPAIIASSALVAVFMAGMSLAIASQTPRRAFATGAVLAYFVIFSALGSILVETTTGELQRYFIMLSPVAILDGTVHWLFNARPSADTPIGKVDLAGAYYFLVALAYSAASLSLLYRRFLRMSA